jgi:hypothetical protein
MRPPKKAIMPETSPVTPTFRKPLFPGAPPLPQSAPKPEPPVKKGSPEELKAEALKALETAIVQSTPPKSEEIESSKLEKPTIPVIPGMPKIPKKPILPKALANAENIEKEEGIIIKPKIETGKLTLKLNPEDFMIKQRPKTITAVPKDARLKLKTSPFAPVSNPTETPPPKGPVAPTQLIKTKSSIPTSIPQLAAPLSVPSHPPIPSPQPAVPLPEPSQPPMPTPQPATQIPKSPPKAIPLSQPFAPAPSAPAPEIAPDVLKAQQAQQSQNLKQTIMDLKIKKANLQKMTLEFEMQELTGEISTEELEQKKVRMNALVQKVDQQIHDLENML